MTDSEGNEIGKLFVGGLSQATNSESLRIYFVQFGDLEDAVVMMDNKTGRSRGFGYVKYKDPESVSDALDAKPHTLDGKEVDAKQCNVNMKGRNRRSLKVFVGGIGLDQDVASLTNFFEQFGHVTDVNLMMDSNKQRHRGFAFIGFDEESVVNRLINMHYITMNSKQVEIKAMEPPNFGRKNVPSIATQNDPSDHFCRSNGAHFQSHNIIHLGMQPAHVQAYQNSHVPFNSGGTDSHLQSVNGFSSHNPPVYGNAYINSIDSLHQVPSYFQPASGRFINDQQNTVTNSFSTGKVSFPFMFANNFIPIPANAYGSWNSSHNLPTVSNGPSMPTTYPCHILPQQNIIGSSDDYWSQYAGMNVYGQQATAQNFIYPSYYGNSTGSSLRSLQNPYYNNPVIPSQRLFTATSQPSISTSNSVNVENATIQSTKSETDLPSPSIPTVLSSSSSTLPNTQTASLSIPYRTNIMNSNGSTGVYYSTIDQSQIGQNLWCPQLQYPNNIPSSWNLPQMSSTDFLNHTIQRVLPPTQAISRTKLPITDEIKLSECVNPMAKPSGDNPDVCNKSVIDEDSTSSLVKDDTMDIVNTEKSVSIVDKDSSNGLVQQLIPAWAFTVDSSMRTPFWGEVQGGITSQTFGLPPGIVLQPHSNSWNSFTPGQDQLIDQALSYGFIRNTTMLQPINVPYGNEASYPIIANESYLATENGEIQVDGKTPIIPTSNDLKSRENGWSGYRNRKRDTPEKPSNHHKANRQNENSRWHYNNNTTQSELNRSQVHSKDVKNLNSELNFKSTNAAAGDQHGNVRV